MTSAATASSRIGRPPGWARSSSAAARAAGGAEGTGQPLLPAARQAERGEHRLEHRLVAERHAQGAAGQRQCQEGMGVGDRAGVGGGEIGIADVLDAGLEELVAGLAALAEDLAEIGIAARRAGARGDVVEADGNGEFGAQAERLAGLALGQEDAAAQVLAGHVEERVGRLQHRHLDRRRAARGKQRQDVRREGPACRKSWPAASCPLSHGAPLRARRRGSPSRSPPARLPAPSPGPAGSRARSGCRRSPPTGARLRRGP